MKKKRLNINPQVYDDLSNIKEYISKDSAEQADKVIKEIVSAINDISDMPEKGANLQNKVRQKTRYKYLLVYKFAVLYYVGKDDIYVTLVMHTSKDLSALKLISPLND